MKNILENSLVIRAIEQAFSSLSSMIFIYSLSRLMPQDVFSEFSYNLVLYILIGVVVNNAIVYPLQSKRDISLRQKEQVLAYIILPLLLIAVWYILSTAELSARAFFYSVMLAGLNAVRIMWFVHGNARKQFIVTFVHMFAITNSALALIYSEEIFLYFIPVIYFVFLTIFSIKLCFSTGQPKHLFSVLNGGKFMLLAGVIEWYSSNQILIWITSKQKMTLIPGELRIGQLYYGMVIVSLVFYDSLFSRHLLLDGVKKAKKHLAFGLFFICINAMLIIYFYPQIEAFFSLKIDRNVLLLMFPYYILAIIYLYFKVNLRVREQYGWLLILQIASVILVQSLITLRVIPIIDYVFYYSLIALNIFMAISHGFVLWKSKYLSVTA